MTVSARQCAAEILKSVMEEKRPLDEALSRHGGLALLEGRDRAFARLMVMTVLRRLGQIDAVLAPMLVRPLPKHMQIVRHCLRLGAAQLLWLETPPHAVVHAMVETVAALGYAPMKGLVNAVLKRAAQEGPLIVSAQDSAALNLPAWLFAAWRETYGEAPARALAEARLHEPPLDITVKNDAEGWAEKLGGTCLPTGSVRIVRAGKVDTLPGYADGEWWVQDVAASLPALLLGGIRGLEVLELCAAPGGKTAQLAAAGAKVTAVDKSPRRLERLRENLARLHLGAEIVEADVLKFRPKKPFDAVLLDAPCSATGTLRRHPEVVWHKSQADIRELAALQRRLLRRAAAWVKPGGRLVYCVCSLQPEEGELQAAAFAGEHSEFSVVSAPAPWKTYGITDASGALRTHPGCWPEYGGMDGFYAICWQRLNNP